MRKYFEFFCPTKINCGKDALKTIGAELEYLGATRPLILASTNATRMGALDKVMAAFKGSAIKAGVICNNAPNRPDVNLLREMKKQFEEAKCDGIIAVGGEGAMDAAKALKLFLSENCDDILPLAGTSKKPEHDIPLVTVPTECGSGHETCGFLEVEDKFVATPSIVPNVVVIDGKVSAIAPARVTAAGGVYALANAIEAYIGADEMAPVEIFAQKTVKLIFDHLLKVVKDEESEEDCLGIGLASALGGIAYGNVPYGAAHALAEAMSDVANEPVEEMTGITLLSAINNMTDEQKEKLAGLLPYTCSREKLAEIPASEKAARTIENIETLLSALREASGMPLKIRETKIQRELFGVVSGAAQDKRAAISSVVPIGQEAFLKILNDAY